jgi:hypothetical protein
VLGAGLLGALGSTIALIAFAFWQARRAASASDGQLDAVRKSGQLELQLAAKGKAIEERDKTIETLKAERDRLDDALRVAIEQRDQAIAASIVDSKGATDAIRDVLRPR